jgi:hypothetical protein
VRRWQRSFEAVVRKFLFEFERARLNSQLDVQQLLVIANSTLMKKRSVTRVDIERVARRHRVRFLRRNSDRPTSTQQLFVHTATAWFDFIGRLAPEVSRPAPFARNVAVFERFMREEQGLSATTIDTRLERVRHFLTMLPEHVRSLRHITVRHIDRYLVHQSDRGWSRASLGALASTLRRFIRFAEAR